KEAIDFFIAKGFVDRIAEVLDLSFAYEATEIDGLHPGRTAHVYLNDQVVGFIGELHPNVEKDYDLKQTYVFELNYDKLMAVAVGYINYEPIPRFPGVTRDIALVINRDLPSAKLLDTIKQNGGDIFQNAQVFDVY
ncbi:phenylalanine--tRNA ligase subunit beta, partial [Staphylococcus cohnii]